MIVKKRKTVTGDSTKNKVSYFMILVLFGFFLQPWEDAIAQTTQKPNVIIIITDDQGYGDLGFNGNPHIKTPVLDELAKNSVRFNNFYVSPVCAPTRASLMTGRYSLRTGIRDTYNGGAMMASNEVTIAEMLEKANYSTGIFGKWHLGDNYPSRPSDQGFDESLIHLAGGMGQVGDVTTYFKGNRSYYDPVLWHNNAQEQYEGYCSDIFADSAIKFIEENKDVPFFCYLSFNAPHTPLQVPEKYYDMYKDIDPSSGFKNDDGALAQMTEKDKEDARKVYAMVTNIDDNIGKLFEKLKALKIEENTLVIFMTDNGPQQLRYNGGLRGLKSTVYRGGVRVPFYVSYPAEFKKNRDIETTSAHIDILPTLAEICGVELAKERKIDGRSLLPLLKGQQVDWKDRSLFFYWTRRYPELYVNMALQKGGYKLVGNTDYDAKIGDFELYNIETDPFEQTSIRAQNLPLAQNLKTELDNRYKELITSHNLVNPPKIIVGDARENPIILNRNEADGARGIWSQEEIFGKWNVEVKEGLYDFSFKFINPLEGNGKMYLETNGIIHQKLVAEANLDVIEMKGVSLPEIDGELIPFYSVAGKSIFPLWVQIEKID